MKIILALIALNTIIPPPPPNWKGSKGSWERAVKHCYDKPTEWARDRCMRNLYDN